MIRSLFCITILGLAMFAAGCEKNPVGRRCLIGGDGDGTTTVNPTALECESRICLKVQQTRALPEPPEIPESEAGKVEYSPLCTDRCESADDCDRVPESPCVLGFTCQIVRTVGPFCCEKVCVCKDYIALPEDGSEPETPAACLDPNSSCNLSKQ